MPRVNTAKFRERSHWEVISSAHRSQSVVFAGTENVVVFTQTFDYACIQSVGFSPCRTVGLPVYENDDHVSGKV